jgi:hypothetical protein
MNGLNGAMESKASVAPPLKARNYKLLMDPFLSKIPVLDQSPRDPRKQLARLAFRIRTCTTAESVEMEDDLITVDSDDSF